MFLSVDGNFLENLPTMYNFFALMGYIYLFVYLVCLLFQSHIDDIHVICGCIKDFLRGLKEPLVTYGLWKDFVHAAGKIHTYIWHSHCLACNKSMSMT